MAEGLAQDLMSQGWPISLQHKELDLNKDEAAN
jgi:hypothetical protein